MSLAIDPYRAKAISKDGRIGYADVIYPMPADEVDDAARDELEASAEAAEEAGLQVEFGGGLVTEQSEAGSESAGIMIGFLVLAITLGSLVAAGLPLLTAILGVAISVAVTALTGAFELTETAPTLATMLGLGRRHRLRAVHPLAAPPEHRRDGAARGRRPGNRHGGKRRRVRGRDRGDRAGRSDRGEHPVPDRDGPGRGRRSRRGRADRHDPAAGPARLAGARVARFNRAVTWRPWPGKSSRETASLRYARFVTRRPLVVTLVCVAGLLAVALPATHMKLGLPDGGSKPTDNTERKAYDLLTEGFGPGFNGVLTAVVDAPGAPAQLQERARHRRGGRDQEFPNVAAVSEPAQNEAGDVTIVSVTPKTGPASDETRDLVDMTRADEIPAALRHRGVRDRRRPLNIDTADQLAAALPKYIAVVVGLALLLLMVVFRSVLVPIKAAAGFLLSIAARWAWSCGCSRTATWPTCSPSPRPDRSSASCQSC